MYPRARHAVSRSSISVIMTLAMSADATHVQIGSFVDLQVTYGTVLRHNVNIAIHHLSIKNKQVATDAPASQQRVAQLMVRLGRSDSSCQS